MSNDRLLKLLADLKQELATATLDEQTHDLLHSLDRSVTDAAAPDAERENDDTSALLDQARALEARFAARHPAAEQFMRSIVDTLARIGV